MIRATRAICLLVKHLKAGVRCCFAGARDSLGADSNAVEHA